MADSKPQKWNLREEEESDEKEPITVIERGVNSKRAFDHAYPEFDKEPAAL